MEGEREGEKHQCVVASHMPPNGDLAHNPGTCPDWKLNQDPFICRLAFNPLSHTSQCPCFFPSSHNPSCLAIKLYLLVLRVALIHSMKKSKESN